MAEFGFTVAINYCPLSPRMKSNFNKKLHFVYFVGCKVPNSDEQCYVCRVVKKAGTEQCLDECPSTSMINKNKECVGKYNKRTTMGLTDLM